MEIRFALANGMFKMKMEIDRNGPRRMPPTALKILTQLISRYQLPLSSVGQVHYCLR
jgi:hypothetical protein